MYDSQKQMFEMLSPQMAKEFASKTPEEVKNQAMYILWPLTAVNLIASVLSLIGGICMIRLRGYALSVTGAVATVIPCVTCTACCGVGEGIGIWALVVLMNEEVRAAFR
jgi:hypothetical protein